MDRYIGPATARHRGRFVGEQVPPPKSRRGCAPGSLPSRSNDLSPQDAGPSSAEISPLSPDNVPPSLDDALSPVATDRRRSTKACLPRGRFVVAGRRLAATGAESPSRYDGLPPAAADRRLSALLCLPWRRSVYRDAGSPSLYDGSPPPALDRRRSTTVCRPRRRLVVRGRWTAAAGDEAPSGDDGSPSREAGRCPGTAIRRARRQSVVERR